MKKQGRNALVFLWRMRIAALVCALVRKDRGQKGNGFSRQ